jgi:hypothetical protein
MIVLIYSSNSTVVVFQKICVRLNIDYLTLASNIFQNNE